MDVCLPSDFLIVDDYMVDEHIVCRGEPLRFVDDGPASYEDGYWLGAEALVAPALVSNDPAQVMPRTARAPEAYDPTWNVV